MLHLVHIINLHLIIIIIKAINYTNPGSICSYRWFLSDRAYFPAVTPGLNMSPQRNLWDFQSTV